MDELSRIPATIQNAILNQMDALREYQDEDISSTLKEQQMPRPIWATRPYDDDGVSAWEKVKVIASGKAANPCCVYIHIPFCKTRCGYCDCYSFPLTEKYKGFVDPYVDALLDEFALWENVCKPKPITSVHFGGGTPLMVGQDQFERIMEKLRNRFPITGNTELAIESTSSTLNSQALDWLRELGFTRLHIGVQSLQDNTRHLVGRHETGDEVLKKISYAVSTGWIVSSDIIVGLPDYHADQMIDDIKRMIRAGVEGFSIYELVYAEKNHAFFEKLGLLDQPIMDRYVMFQTAFHMLHEMGFRNNVYNHLSIGRDKNIYFTCPNRKEDLVGLGVISDGFFGTYHYRHMEYDGYLSNVSKGNPGFLGGIQRTPKEARYLLMENEARSGRLDPFVFIQNLGEEKASSLFSSWIKRGFVHSTLTDETFCEITPNGAWFIGKMLKDIINAQNVQS